MASERSAKSITSGSGKAPDDYYLKLAEYFQGPDYEKGIEDIESRIRSITLQATEYEDQRGIKDIQTQMENDEDDDSEDDEHQKIISAMENIIRARVRSKNPETNSEIMLELLMAKEMISFFHDLLVVVESEYQHSIYNNDSVHIKEKTTMLPEVLNFVKQHGFHKIMSALKPIDLKDLEKFKDLEGFLTSALEKRISALRGAEMRISLLRHRLLQIEYAKIGSTSLQGTEYEDQREMGYVQPRMRSRQPVPQACEYEDEQGIEYIQTGMRSRQPVLQADEYEDQQGIEYIQMQMSSRKPVLQAGEYEDQQGIEYIQMPMRSRVLQAHDYEDDEESEYIQTKMRSRQQVLQADEHEDQQGIEYIQIQMRSRKPVLQAGEYEHQQGIEYIQMPMRSRVPQAHDYEGDEESEYIQTKMRSRQQVLQAGEHEDQQGIEYIQRQMRSRQPVLQAGEYEDQQEIKYIQTRMRSIQQTHDYEDDEEIKLLLEAARTAPKEKKLTGRATTKGAASDSEEEEDDDFEDFKWKSGIVEDEDIIY